MSVQVPNNNIIMYGDIGASVCMNTQTEIRQSVVDTEKYFIYKIM